MIKKQFPTPYDVEQAMMFRTTSFDALKRFIQRRGLFIAGWGKQDIAGFAANILFDHQDYMQLRRIALGAEASASISGFTLRHRLHDVDVETLTSDIIRLRADIAGKNESLARRGEPIPKLDMPVRRSAGLLGIHFEYERVIPGRVELMQRVQSQVDLTMENIGGTQWRVVCYPQANQDVKRIQKLLEQMAGGGYEAYTISLEPLSREERIQFFDDLLQLYSRDREWIFEQVTGITIRRPATELGDESLRLEEEDSELPGFDGDQEIEEVDREYVQSITQAILQGKNLRTNKFVQDCEKQGFYFLAMIIELINRETPELVQVMIRFKLSPQMFEVVLGGMARRDEMGERPTTFSGDRQREILREFWNTSHEIWHQIHDKASRPPPGQLSFADEIERKERVLHAVGGQIAEDSPV
jgi:hypothetical protein